MQSFVSRIHVATLVVLLASPAGWPTAVLAQSQGQIIVGRNVMVSSSSPGWMHAEYTADADPSNPNRVMVCSMRHSQQRNQLASVIYISDDGGKSWSLSLEDTVSRFNGVWDPACRFGLDNQAFLVTLILPDTAIPDSLRGRYWHHQWWQMGGDNNMHVHRSLDAGKTWEPARYLSFIDYETLTIDRTNSRYRGRAYLYGNTGGRGVWLLYSTDSGKTWVRSERNDEEDYYPRDGTILPNGTLLLPMNKRSSNQPGQEGVSMTVAASRDGGVHIDRSVAITQLYQCPNASLGFGMASDHSTGPFQGRAYVVFPNASRGRCLPFVSWTDDQGKTWSKPVLVSDALARPPGARPTEHILTKIAVNRDGVVGVTWYDPGDDSTNSHINLRFSASLDGGETWLPSVRVSEYGYVVKNPPEMAAHTIVRGGGVRTGGSGERSDEASVSVLVSARSYYQNNSNPGDYSGMAAGADGAFHTFFVDNRSGNGEMYSARVTVSGTVAKSDAKVAGLTNVTSLVELQYVSSVWDPSTATISLEYQLFNNSADTIEGPVKLRVTSLTSSLGAPVLIQGGQVLGGVGTVLDFSKAIPAGGLRPGQTSGTDKVTIRLDRLQEYHDYSLAHMGVKVFAKKKGGVVADSAAKK